LGGVRVKAWKQIIGFSNYQVNYSGQVRRVYKNGKTRILAQFKKAGSGKKISRDRLFVKMTDDKGKAVNILVHQIVAKNFLGKQKDGQVIYHINGCVKDNWVSNLAYIDRRSLGKLTGASSRRKPVVKIDTDGEIVDCYSSAREAGRQNYMSYQTITDRCNLKSIKNSIFAPDGYAYAWEDDERRMTEVLRRIELAYQSDEEVINLEQYEQKYAYEF